tara:strand:+ start:132 stop:311 length:180 start_codon:yes stop_codon:yes gene_type:complete
MKYLGYMNGWGNNKPKEYEECKSKCDSKDIKASKQGVYSPVTTYVCESCGIRWKVDSSG